jgi:phosphoglycolate phosphatase
MVLERSSHFAAEKSKRMTGFPLLVLDLDGTLVDSLPDLTAALNRLMAAQGLAGFLPADIKSMIGDGTKKLIERAFAARGHVPEANDNARFVADYTAQVAVATRPYKQVGETLATLQQAGWRFALCTNKSTAATKALLAALGLAHWFAALGCGDTFRAHKPDPAHLLGTIAAAGATPENAVMVGDHANDIAVAKAVGIPSIFAAWGYGDPAMAQGASAVAQRFTDLAAIAPRLLAKAEARPA